LLYYRARHAVFAGTAALAAAILCAALLTGESLQAGLRRGLRERLGATRSAVYLTEGVFAVSLAKRLPNTQAALLLNGQLLDSDGAVCADKAQVIGIPDEDPPHVSLPPDEAERYRQAYGQPNRRARELLAVRECAVRFEKPSLYSVEMPLGTAKEARLARRPIVLTEPRAYCPDMLVPPDFALQASSVPPVNIFQQYGPLAEAAGVPGFANLLVSTAAPTVLERALAEKLSPEDAGLVLEAGDRGLEADERVRSTERRESMAASPITAVKSRRVFLPPAVPEALAAAGLKASVALFHLADAFEVGTNATPYGFVAAVTPGSETVPGDLGDDEVVINDWLAGMLGISTNDLLTLRWRRFEAGGRLVADSRAFRVRAVIPTAAAARVKAAMPLFPGLEGVDSCSAWDVGMPMDEEKLKDAANEDYWKQWRETPKAFLTHAAGKACFGQAFGDAMCVRVDADETVVRGALRRLSPAQMGFVVRPVWEQGVRAAAGSTDFKGLFVGMACVLMASALLLSALSLSLALDARRGEMALLRALGWSRAKVARALASEWGVPLLLGALAGGGFGAALARALVWGLGRFWSDAFAGMTVGFHFSWLAASEAAGVSAALTFAVLLGTVWRMARRSPAELWRTTTCDRAVCVRSRSSILAANLFGGVLAAAALAVMALSPSGAAANGAFFGGGFLLLVSLVLFVGAVGMAWSYRGEVNGRPDSGGREKGFVGRIITSPAAAGVMRAAAAPRRSAPVVILLAVGVFLTVGILSMRHDPAAGCDRPSSGSGGFAAIVTSAAPMARERGLELARRVSGAKGVVPVRVREGDEAGCLNMNLPSSPRVLGVDARAMMQARAFEPEDSGGIWALLEMDLGDGTVPALAADQAMLSYSLKAKADPRDGTVYEYGAPGSNRARVRVVGVLPVRVGILQGALLVDETRFAELFPSDTGYRMWLCDYAPYLLREAAEAGNRRSETRGRRAEGETPNIDRRSAIAKLRHPEPGVTVETAEERLRLLGAVEGAYIDMFLVLGGLGVVLGVFGVALVILRGVQERCGELALLNAVGLPRSAAVRMLAAEYGALVLAGLAVGVVPALAAIQPAARSLGGRLPWAEMTGILSALALCACGSVLAAAYAASRRFGPEVLKQAA